ncbi:MAG: hypothetical protein R3A10_04345 [Caldilineaceae bacterium]
MLLPPGGYVVLGRNGDAAVNGGVAVDYVYASVSLANGDDEARAHRARRQRGGRTRLGRRRPVHRTQWRWPGADQPDRRCVDALAATLARLGR